VANPLRALASRLILKAMPDLGRLGGQVTDMTEQVRALTQAANQQTGTALPLPRDPRWASAPFGPGTPLIPSALDAPRTDTGRAEPRIWQYPVSWNLPGTNNRLHPWPLLRSAADGISLFRRCIEIRKDHMTGLDWDVVISQSAVETAQGAEPDTGRADVEGKLRDRLSPEIERAAAFLATPDRANGYQFAQWLSMLLEEVFVLDALPIYPRYTFGGDLWSLEIIDGSTIKPLLDERGGRPLAPFPAYQQILYGFPRGEFTADVATTEDGQQSVPGGYAADQLIYSRRVARVWTPYGYSSVEQALDDGDLYLKRHLWMKREYDSGTSIAGLYETPETLGWSPEQLLEYERAWNDALGGDTVARHEARFLPPGVKAAKTHGSDALAERYKPEYDLHLIKLLAAHFDTTLPELGFTEAKGLGSDGYHEGQENVQYRKTRPIIRYVESLITWILRNHLRTPAELEFKFLGLDDEDDPAADDIEGKRMATGAKTLNERRDDLGRPRYAFPEADMPMIVTQRGVIFLEGSSEQAPAGTMIGPTQPVAEGDDSGGQGDSGKPAPGKPGQDDTTKAAELAAYRRWAKKTKAGGRPFRFEHLDKVAAAAAGVDLDRAEFAKASDAGPKVSGGRTWPGWDKDLEVARHYAPLLSQALTGAVATTQLAEDWLAARKAASSDPGYADAFSWLGARDYDITTVLGDVLQAIYTEGYLIGDRAAATLVAQAGTAIDWAGWTPGDWKAAQEILGADGRGDGLAALLSRAEVTISSIADNRLDILAERLAQALDEGWSVDRLAGELAGILDDPRWADMVAVTETNRAVSAATLARYLDNGVPAKEWLTALDDRVCRICSENEGDGPVLLSAYFSSGDDAPPGHPDCRCAIGPAWDVSVATEDLSTATAEE